MFPQINVIPTHIHTIDPDKSELYRCQQQTFVASYTHSIAYYRIAWVNIENFLMKNV